MRKTALLLACVALFSLPAYAQDAVLSLMDDSVVKIPSSTEDNKKDNEKAEKEEDKGIFSFMNFWKKEQKPATETSPQAQETPEQKLTREADSGDLNAQLTLGYMYLYGDDGAKIEQNFSKAFQYYEKAAAQNDNVAINNLGSLYYSGIGTKQDMLKAAQMFSKAASLGNTESMINLAFIYISGTGSSFRPQEAIELFSKASEAGNPTANFMMGYAYYKGYMVEKDYIQAFNLVKKAANSGYDEALYVLSSMYMQGLGTPQNYGNGVKALNSAVMQGNVPAMMELGYILGTGDKYPKNIYKAHILFNIASVRGAEGAAERRDILEKGLKIEELLQAQAEAEAYKPKPTELTIYIRQTFGENIRKYIDDRIEKKQISEKK